MTKCREGLKRHLVFPYTPVFLACVIHGRCSILLDDGLCASHAARGKPALLVLQVEIDECFFHCGNALLRSEIWHAASWPSSVAVSFGEEIAENLMPMDKSKFIEEFDCFVQDRYATDL
jgi:uncharacterized protein